MLKNTGIIKTIDNLGRILIPKEIREKLGIKENDRLEIYLNNNKLVLKKYEIKCIFCDSKENLIKYKNKL